MAKITDLGINRHHSLSLIPFAVLSLRDYYVFSAYLSLLAGCDSQANDWSYFLVTMIFVVMISRTLCVPLSM